MADSALHCPVTITVVYLQTGMGTYINCLNIIVATPADIVSFRIINVLLFMCRPRGWINCKMTGFAIDEIAFPVWITKDNVGINRDSHQVEEKKRDQDKNFKYLVFICRIHYFVSAHSFVGKNAILFLLLPVWNRAIKSRQSSQYKLPGPQKMPEKDPGESCFVVVRRLLAVSPRISPFPRRCLNDVQCDANVGWTP
jgi:hypothetical protein